MKTLNILFLPILLFLFVISCQKKKTDIAISPERQQFINDSTDISGNYKGAWYYYDLRWGNTGFHIVNNAYTYKVILLPNDSIKVYTDTGSLLETLGYHNDSNSFTNMGPEHPDKKFLREYTAWQIYYYLGWSKEDDSLCIHVMDMSHSSGSETDFYGKKM